MTRTTSNEMNGDELKKKKKKKNYVINITRHQLRQATWSIKVTFSVWLTIFDLISNSHGIMITHHKDIITTVTIHKIIIAYAHLVTAVCRIDQWSFITIEHISITWINTNVIQTWYSSPEIKETIMSIVQIVGISSVQWVLMRNHLFLNY